MDSSKRMFSLSPEFEKGGGGAPEKISDEEDLKLRVEINALLGASKKEYDLKMDPGDISMGLSKRDLAVYKRFKEGALSFGDMQNYKMEIMSAVLEDEESPRDEFYSWLSMEWQKDPKNFEN